jgi:hypothetical protein
MIFDNGWGYSKIHEDMIMKIRPVSFIAFIFGRICLFCHLTTETRILKLRPLPVTFKLTLNDSKEYL